MSSISISLITVTFNAARTIDRCIASVIAQQYPHLQHIIIDGQSTDGTLAIVNKYKASVSHLISEPDGGIYDAMNKGIAMASGDVIGILNADDYFADHDILQVVSKAFAVSGADIIYGDIDYVNNSGAIIRKWRGGSYKPAAFNWGWMPAHPSFYVKRALFDSLGYYQTAYGTAADYELMLRFIHRHKAKSYYINKVMVKMLTGGVGNKNIRNRIKAWQNDYKAMCNNGLAFPYVSVIFKPLRKIIQYLR